VSELDELRALISPKPKFSIGTVRSYLDGTVVIDLRGMTLSIRSGRSYRAGDEVMVDAAGTLIGPAGASQGNYAV
jgi:hypothetical protein